MFWTDEAKRLNGLQYECKMIGGEDAILKTSRRERRCEWRLEAGYIFIGVSDDEHYPSTPSNRLLQASSK